jgi:flagellin-like hook-associated protein FlgL
MTAEELQAFNTAQLKDIAVSVAQSVKDYVDNNTLSPEDVEKLERANTLAESLLGLFDSDGDGSITLEEFTAKLDEIYATLSGVQELQNQITNLAQNLGALTNRVDTLENNLSTNYYTKSEIETALTVNKDEIVQAVNQVFNPTDGDGATL